jgi:hypothetical protein
MVSPDPNAPPSSYYVEADNLQLRATLPDRAAGGSTSAEVTHLTLTGAVLFEERTDPTQTTAPVRVEGDWINVADANTAAMTLRANGQPVVATVDGTTLRGGEIAFDQRNGRFDVLTPGDLSLMVDRDPEGRPVDPPLPLNISWQGTLTFNGRQAVLTSGVRVRTPSEQLQTQRLVASLAAPVRLDKLQWDEQMRFEKLECTGGVTVDRQTTDAGGLASREHAEIPNLTIERSLGQLYASGPGWMRSVQRERARPLLPSSTPGRTAGAFGSMAPHQAADLGDARAAAPLSRPPGAASGLTYLRVDFQRDMRGDLDRREITFAGQVHCVRGPIADWDQPLHVEGLPQLPEETVVLDAATLSVHQWHRTDGKESYGLVAEGGVEIEGGLRRSGIFTARGERLSYDQSKDLMILDGGAGLAHLVLEHSLGGERQSCQAASVHFWPSRPEVLGNYVRNVAGEF